MSDQSLGWEGQRTNRSGPLPAQYFFEDHGVYREKDGWCEESTEDESKRGSLRGGDCLGERCDGGGWANLGTLCMKGARGINLYLVVSNRLGETKSIPQTIRKQLKSA